MNYGTPGDRIDQIDAMRMGVDYRFRIVCRGFSMSARPLSIGESVEVGTKVSQRLNEMTEFEKNRLNEHSLLAYETLVLASTSDYGTNDPKISEYILKRLTPDELSFLFKQYVAECDKVNPCLEMMDAKDIRPLVEALKKSPKEDLASQLIGLSFTQQVSTLFHLLLGD